MNVISKQRFLTGKCDEETSSKIFFIIKSPAQIIWGLTWLGSDMKVDKRVVHVDGTEIKDSIPNPQDYKGQVIWEY